MSRSRAQIEPGGILIAAALSAAILAFALPPAVLLSAGAIGVWTTVAIYYAEIALVIVVSRVIQHWARARHRP